MCRRSLLAECWKSERLDLTLVHVSWTLIMVRPRCEAGNNAQHGSGMCFFMRGSGTCIISSTSSTIWASNLHVCLHTCTNNICECCCLTHQDHNFLLLHTNIYNLACEQSLSSHPKQAVPPGWFRRHIKIQFGHVLLVCRFATRFEWKLVQPAPVARWVPLHPHPVAALQVSADVMVWLREKALDTSLLMCMGHMLLPSQLEPAKKHTMDLNPKPILQNLQNMIKDKGNQA